MELKRYKDLLAIKNESEIVGFHARNLEVANLTESLWQDMYDHSTQLELEAWNNEIDDQVGTAIDARHIHSISINVAQVCNLNCTYCGAGGDGTYGSTRAFVDLEKIRSRLTHVVERLPIGEKLHIHFLGGEPLLYPKAILEIVSFIKLFIAGKNHDLEFSITTNGTLFKSETVEFLARNKFGVTISIDGAPEVQNLHRPAKGRFSSSELLQHSLLQIKRVRTRLAYLSVSSVFGAHNTRVTETYNYLTSLNLDWDFYNFNFANQEKSEAVVKKYIEEMNQTAHLAYLRGGYTEVAKISQFRMPLSRLEAKTKTLNYCGAGKSLVQVDTKGQLYACNWLMNDKEEVIKDLDQRDEYATDLTVLNQCDTCWARHLCGGGCMAAHKLASGKKFSKDPIFCLRTRSLAATAILYFAKSYNLLSES